MHSWLVVKLLSNRPALHTGKIRFTYPDWVCDGYFSQRVMCLTSYKTIQGIAVRTFLSSLVMLGYCFFSESAYFLPNRLRHVSCHVFLSCWWDEQGSCPLVNLKLGTPSAMQFHPRARLNVGKPCAIEGASSYALASKSTPQRGKTRCDRGRLQLCACIQDHASSVGKMCDRGRLQLCTCIQERAPT